MPGTATLADIVDEQKPGVASLSDIDESTPEERATVSKAIASVPYHPPKMEWSSVAPIPEVESEKAEPYSLKKAAVGGLTDILTHPEPGAETGITPLGPEAVKGAEELGTKGQRWRGAARLASTGLQAAAPVLAPTAGLEAPVSAAIGMGTGYGASKIAGKVSEKLGAEPETKQVVEDLAFWAPTVAGMLTGVSGTVSRTAEGEPVAATGKAFGGRVAAGVAKTPGAYDIGAKVGPFQAGVSIPRSPAGAPSAELQEPIPNINPGDAAFAAAKGHANAPTDSDVAVAVAAQREHLQATRMASGLPPVEPPAPAPPPPPAPQIGMDQVAKLGEAIAKLPPDLRAQAMVEAHGKLSQVFMQMGKVVNPHDGKLTVITKPEQADKLATDFINGEVERRDKLAEEAQKKAESAQGKSVRKPSGVVEKPVEAAENSSVGLAHVSDIAEPAQSSVSPAATNGQPSPSGEVRNGAVGETGSKPNAANQPTHFAKGDRVTLQDGSEATIHYSSPGMRLVRLVTEDGRRMTVAGKDVNKLQRVAQSPTEAQPQPTETKVAPEVIGETTAKPRPAGEPLEYGFNHQPAEDLGNAAREATQKEQGALPRGERRKVERTPEEQQTQELFGKARKELGEDATSDQVMARVGELKKAGENSPAVVEKSAKPLQTEENKASHISEISPEEAPKFKHRSTQVNIPEESEASQAIEAARSRISKEDLAGDGKDIGGNHVTVRWGLQAADDADLSKLKSYISSLAPFEASLGKTSKFKPSESSDGAAVIQAPIEAPELQKINEEIAKHGDFTEPTFKYSPHATVAYVKPEKADRYTGMSVTHGKKFKVNSIAISDRNGGQEEVPLKGTTPKSVTPKSVEPEHPHLELGEHAAHTEMVATPTVEKYANENVQMVPTSELDKYKEFDRRATPHPGRDEDAIEKLKADIKANGLKEPLILKYGSEDKKAHLWEGNHRLAAAKELGIKELPVRVITAKKTEDHYGVGVRGHQMTGEVPADLKPSDIGIEARAVGAKPKETKYVLPSFVTKGLTKGASEEKPEQKLRVHSVPSGFGVIDETGKILARAKTIAKAEALMADLQHGPLQIKTIHGTTETLPAEKLKESEAKPPAEKPAEQPVRYRMGDLVEKDGKKYEVGFVNPGGSVRLQSPETKERIAGWHSPSELKLAKAEEPKAPRTPSWKKVEVRPTEEGSVEAVPVKAEPEEKGAVSLANAVYEKLKAGESLGNVTEFNKLTEKNFGASRVSGKWTPKDAFDAMEAGVNKYLIEYSRDLMKMDAKDGLEWLRRQIMANITSQGTRTEEQIKNQQFSTPPTEAYVAAKVANITRHDVVLEPSAGNGGLAVFAKAAGAEVHVNEISERRREMLEAVGFPKPTAHDGELINALLDPKIKPTVVLMNPPFSASAIKDYAAKNRNQYGFNHVDQALQRLEDGGRLVAILGGGQANEPNGGAALTSGSSGDWFQRLAKNYTVRANVRIHGKEYQKYGTSFATRIIVIDKVKPTEVFNPAYGRDKLFENVVKGNFNTLEEAYTALRQVAESRPQLGGEHVTTRTEGTEPATRSGSREGAGISETESGSGVHPSAVRPSHGVLPGADAGNRGQVESGNRPAESHGSVGTVRPSETGERVPLHQPGNEPQAPTATEAAQSVRRSGENIDRERPLQLPEVEGLTLGREKESEREQEDSSAYVAYKPVLKGPAHPGNIVESKTMATVPLPEITYKPSLPDSVIKEGKLSAVQLEAISIAGQQNEIILPSGHRASALIGDGTGVGKGRIGAGVLWDNFRKGRKRLLWVSEKWDLMQDAKRDFKGIGAADMAKGVKAFQKYNVTDPIDHEGVLFTTYALIRSGDKKGNTRVAQLQKWLRGENEAEGGYMLFDESHNLKNAVTGSGSTPPSEIGKTVKKLLEDNPKLRTASLSATAATDVMNLGYLDRLGLWGPGTSFPNGFGEFSAQISGGGISAMEMVARELKAQGKYVSRTLSFKGVTYQEIEHKLSDEQKELYRTAVKAWASVVQQAEDTIKNTTNGGSRAVARFMSLFYGAQLRFFNVLLTTLKIPTAIEDTNKALDQGKSVVITLVNTNEAAQNREKNKEQPNAGDEDEPPDYDFGPAEMLTDLVREHYPTQQYSDNVDSEGRPIKVPVVDADGNPVQNPEAIRQRDELIKNVKRDLKLPSNPLDILINSLGGPEKVAELTGRKERYDESVGRFVKRGGESVKRDEVNLVEMRAFQEGKKEVAILSNAAGTGISLHAGNDAINQKKRHHITLQMGWSADKAMQMLGRTHRANQVHPPEYNTIVTDLGGEKRFSATIAKRLGSLGALSKGQKNAMGGGDAMEKVNFESEQGKKSTNTFYRQLLDNAPIPGTEGENGNPLPGMTILRDLRVLKTDPKTGIQTVPDADRTNVTRLLNRLLALDPGVQNAVYEYFYDIFQATVQHAVEDGTLDTGVKELPGDHFEVKDQKAISKEPKTGAETFYYPIEAKVKTNRMPVEKVKKALEKGDDQHARLLRSEKGKLLFVKDAKDIVHANGHSTPASYVVTPSNGTMKKVENYSLYGYKDIAEEAAKEVKKQDDRLTSAKSQLEYAKKTAERYAGQSWAENHIAHAEEEITKATKALAEAEKAAENPLSDSLDEWRKQYDEAPDHTSEEHHLIGGAVLRWWNQIREAASDHLHIYTAVDSKTGKRVVGVEVPGNSVRKLLARISGNASTVSGGQLATDVLKNNLSYTLEQNVQVRKGRVNGKAVLQLIPPNDNVATNLKRMGVIYERGVVPVYYVPTFDFNEVDEKVLGKVLEQYPVKQDESTATHLAGESGSFEPGRIRDYINDNLKELRGARELERGTFDLEKRHEARVLRAKDELEKANKQYGGKAALPDYEQVYHHLENPNQETLTSKQDKVLDDTVLPIMEQNAELYEELKQGGVPAENYVHRVVKGKGGWFDRIVAGIKGTGKGNLLSKSAPQTKGRSMMAIESPDGERRVVSIKGGKATMWEKGQPLELGDIKRALGRSAESNETFPEGEPNSIFHAEGKIVEGPDGYDWKIVQATTKEIEANTELRYYHNALASALVSNLQLAKAVDAMRFVEAFKSSDEFADIAHPETAGNPPKGWRITQLPQFKGYYFEPHYADVLDRYAQRLQTQPSALDQVGSFMRVAMLLNPIMHPLNVGASWTVDRGLTGFLPTRIMGAARAGMRAVKAVSTQNEDFLNALDVGAPLQSHREATAKITQLFFDQLGEGLTKQEPWALKVAKNLGMAPITLIKALHNFSSRVAWISNDILFLQAAYERQGRGMDFREALDETGRTIPEYRIPAHILNSRTASKIMESKWATIFGAYHYGLLRSFGEAGKSALGLNERPAGGEGGRAADVAKGWDRLALIGLVAMALYPLLDEMAQKLTGDEHARAKRFGPFAVIDAWDQARKGSKSVTEAAQTSVTPAPQTKAIAEMASNREFYSGRQIFNPHDDWQTQAHQLFRYLESQAGQIGQAQKASESESGKRKFAWQQVGVQFKPTRAEKVARDIAHSKMGTEAPEPGESEMYGQRHDVLDALRQGDSGPLTKAEDKGDLSPAQAKRLRHRARLTPLEDTVYNFTYAETMKVLEAAKKDDNQEEIEDIEKALARKRRNMWARHEQVPAEVE